ncbi:MAG: MarR family EPS-associated transcriptional regulator [Rhizobacter sp.]
MAKKPAEPPAHNQQLELMRLLHDQPAASQREISNRLGLSLGKANYLVRALLDKGLVKMQNFRRSDNKMAYAYQLTPRGVAERVRLTRAFLARKELEFELLKNEIQSLQSQVEVDSKSPARNEHQS